MNSDGFPRAALAQSRAFDVAKHCCHLVGGR